MSRRIYIALLAAALLLGGGLLFAQAAAGASQATPPVSAAPAAEAGSAAAGAASPERPVVGHLPPGEKPIENADEEENSQFKYSFIVRSVAKKTGISKEASYWIFTVINFVILVALGVWLVRKMMPHGFAPRTAQIQKALEEARKSSAEAGARLSEIESRLSQLDAQIASVRAAAEADFSVEEKRIREDAERDARHVIASAEQEISTAARIAQRDLKAFAAGLAVDLAEKKIKVDEATDQALVNRFASQLGKDGK